MLKGDPNFSPRSAKSESVHLSSSHDPEFSSFFLLRRNTSSHSTAFDSESSVTPPLYSGPRSYQKSSRSRESAETHRSKRGAVESRGSVGSVDSASSKYKIVTGWNEKKDDFSGPSSFTSQRHSADPPRPAKEGMEWVWFPKGYWAERKRSHARMDKKHGSPKKWFTRSPARKVNGSTHTSEGKKISNTNAVDVPRIQIGDDRRQTEYSIVSSKGSESETSRIRKLRMGFNFISPAYPHFKSPTGEPEGLYCKTKRNVEGRFLPKPKTSLDATTGGQYGIASQTTMVLEGASSYFETMQKDRNIRHGSPIPVPSTAPLSPASPGGARTRRPGLAPWHRRVSSDSLFSVTSSVHRLLMGRTPAATPKAAETYLDQDGRSFPKVEISESDQHGSNFLPSEARRVNTPPMSETPGRQTRGFFFDMTPPTDEGKGDVDPKSSSTQSRESYIAEKRSRVTTPSREWWDSDNGQLQSPNKSAERPILRIHDANGPPPVPPFELNLPEHFPTSPLCPKHPKNKSGGNGICVYHGRRRSVGLKRRADIPDNSKGLYEGY